MKNNAREVRSYMKKRQVLSGLLLVCGLLCIYSALWVAKVLFQANQTAQNTVSIIFTVVGVLLAGTSLVILKRK